MYILHIEDSKQSKPRPHEETAARLLLEHFKSDIIFLRRSSSKSPDLYVLKTNIRWELKAPTGGGKHTIQNNLREAGHQSDNIILDFRMLKMTDKQGLSRVKEYLRHERHTIKRLKILTKDQEIIDIID